jgi:Ring finger domain
MRFSTDRFVRFLQNIKVPLPEVRRRALMESVRCASDIEDVYDILLDSVSNSPYLSSEQKEELANAFLSSGDNMDALSAQYTTEARADPPVASDENDDGLEFAGTLAMLRLMFSHSRKLMGLPEERRRQITMAIHQTSTVDQIRHLVLDQLPIALSLDRHERALVANDMLDHRYYRLLLPDRLDCNEPLPRLGDVTPQQEAIAITPQECPVCFEEFADYAQARILQCCGQRFCATCVADLTQRQAADCPLCRAPLSPPPSAPEPPATPDESFV